MRFLIWIIILGFLQITVLRDLNFLVIAVILAGFKYGPVIGLLIGGLAGAFSGIFSADPFSMNVALYGIIGLCSGSLKARIFYKEDIFAVFLFSFFGLVLFYLSYFIFTGILAPHIFPVILFSSILSPLFFKMLTD